MAISTCQDAIAVKATLKVWFQTMPVVLHTIEATTTLVQAATAVPIPIPRQVLRPRAPNRAIEIVTTKRANQSHVGDMALEPLYRHPEIRPPGRTPQPLQAIQPRPTKNTC